MHVQQTLAMQKLHPKHKVPAKVRNQRVVCARMPADSGLKRHRHLVDPKFISFCCERAYLHQEKCRDSPRKPQLVSRTRAKHRVASIS